MITVVIANRDRSGKAFERTLSTLRNQTYNDLSVIIVDYGSAAEHAVSLCQLALRYDCNLIRIATKEEWNKAHALNIAIRAALTKAVVVIDADMLLKPNFVQTVVDLLDEKTFVSCRCHYLTKELTENLTVPIDWTCIDKQELSISARGANGACFATYKSNVAKMQGYDQEYVGWGREDHDMVHRARYLGLVQKWASESTQFYHQWHEPCASKCEELHSKNVQRFRQLCEREKQVRRNNRNWGLIK